MNINLKHNNLKVNVYVGPDDHADTISTLEKLNDLLDHLQNYPVVSISIETENEMDEDEEIDDYNAGFVPVEHLEEASESDFQCRAVNTNNPAWPFPLDKRP